MPRSQRQRERISIVLSTPDSDNDCPKRNAIVSYDSTESTHLSCPIEDEGREALMQYRYQCLKFQQTRSGKCLVQFAAKATDINVWAGVPQKRKFEFGEHSGGEAVGFQRPENLKRVKNLMEFYRNPENIIQNPLLCSLRDAPESTVSFTASPDNPLVNGVQLGELQIDVPRFQDFSLLKCIRSVRKSIEQRVPSLAQRTLDTNVLNDLKATAISVGVLQESDTSTDPSLDANEESAPSESDDPTGVLFEESHIADFWEELAAREKLLDEIGNGLPNDEHFLGYSREILLSYLRPVVLVDGQHRLLGALDAARELLNHPDTRSEIEDLISSGRSPNTVEAEILSRESRLLPISLLMSTEPQDQVFQFVVVNQKATPVGKALLGTIVSTTLSENEMEKVVQRLKSAGIEVEEAKVITFLSRHPDSPFAGLVDRGLAGSARDALQWNVFASLISLFRNLKNGKLYGQKNDYAKIWREKYLPESEIISEYDSKGYSNPFEYWSTFDGPWRDVFIKFWTTIRDKFGSTDDVERHNYWGTPRNSNLFNKISLTILAADFFQFLRERKQRLDSVDSVQVLVEDWLEDVNTGYFDKEWGLKGVKKDSVGIRNRWAQLWVDYRKSGGRLPKRTQFSKVLRPD